MNTPPLLVGAGILFWGWQTGYLIIAAVMALILEGSRLVSLRFAFSREDINRFSDLSAVIFGGMFIYLLVASRSTQSVITLIKWLPMALLPLFIAQVYSMAEAIDISALFLIYRRKKKQAEKQPITINISYPYFALCVLSASTANSRTIEFYGGLFILLVWALWSIRSRRVSVFPWIILLLLSGFLGYLGQSGLNRLQISLEEMAITSFADLFSKDRDPYKSTTAIGEIGKLKLSDNILFRVRPEKFEGKTILLREASYNAYRKSVWYAPHVNFEEVKPEADRSTWMLGGEADEGIESIIICQSLKKGRGMLKLPLKLCEITDLPVLKLLRNQYGALKVEEGPGFVKFRVKFRDGSSFDSPPDEKDLVVPEEEMATVSKIALQLDLQSASPGDAVKRLSHYFQSGFMYSLELNRRKSDATPLESFLLHTKKGHCEFFATATVLILRAAGIPARYAVGYSVQEFNNLEGCFVVRDRHAHAWTLVYVDGAWRNLDTTPASWITAEEEAASSLEPLRDLLSYALFKFKEWRWTEKEVGLKKYMGWLILPLLVLLAWRFYSRKRFKKEREKREDKREIKDIRKGTDSPFYLIEERLTQSGYGRRQSETITDWLARVETINIQPALFKSLMPLLCLHYRYRFDPKGITIDEMELLRHDVMSWLERYEEISSPNEGLTVFLF